MDILAAKQIYCRDAETNALLPRLESVKRQLVRMHRGKPKMIIDPRCKRLVDGFSGGYKYKERGNSGTFTEQPEKNKYSHVHDALQYVAMSLFGYADQAELAGVRAATTQGSHGDILDAETDK